MRKVLYCAALLAFTISLLAISYASGEAPEKLVRATIIYKGAIKTTPGLSALSPSHPEDITAKIKKHGGKVKHKFESISAVSAEMAESGLEEISRDPDVLAVERSRPVRAFLHESVPLIGANDVWQRTIGGLNITGEGTSVCVIDTGVDYNHADLRGGWSNKVIAGYNAITGQDCSTNNTACFDDNGHGTHVAGIVAANGTRNTGEIKTPENPGAPEDARKESPVIKSLLNFGRATASILVGHTQAITQVILKWLSGLFF